MGADNQNLTLVFVINGQDVSIGTNQHAPLKSAVHRALAASGDTGRPLEEWEVRDARGVLVDPDRTVEDLGLQNGARLFVSLRVGAGGADARRA